MGSSARSASLSHITQAFVLCDIGLREKKNQLRFEYAAVDKKCQPDYTTFNAVIEYKFQKLEEKSQNGIFTQHLLLKPNGIRYKLSVFSPISDGNDPDEEVLFDFNRDHYNIPYMSKRIILNQNTCRNLNQLTTKKKNLSKSMKNCLPFTKFFKL